MAKADEPVATGKVAMAGEGGLAVRLQLRAHNLFRLPRLIVQQSPRQGVVRLKSGRVLEEPLQALQSPINTDESSNSNQFQPAESANHQLARLPGGNFNKFKGLPLILYF
jgi:hypothetical protein